MPCGDAIRQHSLLGQWSRALLPVPFTEHAYDTLSNEENAQAIEKEIEQCELAEKNRTAHGQSDTNNCDTPENVLHDSPHILSQRFKDIHSPLVRRGVSGHASRIRRYCAESGAYIVQIPKSTSIPRK